MQPGPFGLMPWWVISMTANGVAALACLSIAGGIVVSLHRLRQLRDNRLAVATVVIFFALGGHRLLQVVFQLQGLTGPHAAAFAAVQRNSWWLATAQVIVTLVLVSYLARRKAYGRMLLHAFLYDSFAARDRLAALEAEQRSHQAREAAERERDAHAAMLAAVISNSRSLISVKDLDGRYLMVNPQYEKQFGISQAELQGQTPFVLDSENASVWRQHDLLARTERFETEEWCDHPQGRGYYDTVRFPLYGPDQEVYATCAIAIDVTESRRVAEVVAAARDAAMAASAAKSTFLATMSHEIRTPMNAVIGMTDLLLGTSLDEQQREFVETVRTSGDALIAVINDILDFSKIEAGELHLESAPFTLRDEVESCLDLVAATAAGKGLDLICYVDDRCPARVVGDVVRLRQILINLLSNAVKFTERGEVLVSVDACAADDGRLEVTLQVSDTGIGINPDGVDRLFKSFSQVDASTTRIYGGTGLGLAISQRLAGAMSGELTVTSTFGQGSTFSCTLLLDACPGEPPSSPVTTPGAGGLAGRRALLVDDNSTNLRILDLQLRSLGLVCATAGSAAVALELLDSGYTYDVAVLDMYMPVTDGVQLALALKERPATAAAPLVLLTSVGWRPVGSEESFSAFLTKPVKSGLLRDTVTRLLTEQPEPVAADEPTATVPPRPKPLQILLAEDNLVNQRVAQLMLGRLGYEVDTVSTGQQALHAVQSGSYDVVLMDVQMPVMDGLEATRQIRATPSSERSPHIVAMTASALDEDRNACSAAGMDSYLSKPVRSRELEEILTRISG